MLSQQSVAAPYAEPAAKKIRVWCNKTDAVSAIPRFPAPLC
nr:hypothetical protein ELNCLMMM_00023 [Escherichia coli]WEG97259.1 hypothetical protein MNFJLIIH_00017 [Escherichia coli]WEG98558.1 hypothetical protein NEAPIHCB_00057 [Escherichia coli]